MFRNFLLMYFCRKKIRNFMANLPAYKWWARLSFLFFISLLMSFFSATVINERSNYFHLASSFPQKMFHCSLKHNWLNWKILRPSKSNLISKLVPITPAAGAGPTPERPWGGEGGGRGMPLPPRSEKDEPWSSRERVALLAGFAELLQDSCAPLNLLGHES